VILLDVGPNLGALNRAALIGAQHVVVPLGADLFSIQALKNLGPTLREWRSEWGDRLQHAPDGLDVPRGEMKPAGYVVMQPNLYGGKVTKAYAKWYERIPQQFASSLMGATTRRTSVAADPMSLGVVKHYRSLMPMAHEARKPVFHLQAADGALGSHATAAADAGKDFRRIARVLAKRVGLALP
jgi:cellulose biosynthesis protein BcsQ